MPTSLTKFKGFGSLQSLAGEESIQVDFDFEIQYERRAPPPGLPPPPAKARGEGTVVAGDGRFLPEGFYQLTAASGEHLRLQKLGPTWHILSPP